MKQKEILAGHLYEGKNGVQREVLTVNRKEKNVMYRLAYVDGEVLGEDAPTHYCSLVQMARWAVTDLDSEARLNDKVVPVWARKENNHANSVVSY